MRWSLLLCSLLLIAWTPFDQARVSLEELVADRVLPAGTHLASVTREHGALHIAMHIDGPVDRVLDEWTVQVVHHRYLAAFELPVTLCLAAGSAPCRPLPAFLPDFPPVPSRSWESPLPAPTDMPLDAPGATSGALTQRHIYVSQGHGWAWTETEWWERWATQRGNTWGIVEDFVNAEAINQYLVHYLRNAGATVHTVREADMQSAWVIVDDGDGTDHPANGRYEEVGEFATSTAPGFRNFQAPYPSGTNPMLLGESRYAYTTSTPQAFARWTPNVPENGEYAVYVSYAASANRSHAAHYVVNHAGGSADYVVDQTRHGNTWVLLGTHYFYAGTHWDTGSVHLTSVTDTNIGETVVSADAVRLGGGMGVIARGTGSGLTDGPTSGRPRWEECSRYAAQFNGAPESVYDYSSSDNKDDVGTRSRYAAWQHEAGEDAVFVSWHTNAPNPGVGTSTYVYGPNEPNGDYLFTGTTGSDVLAEFLHHEVVQDIRNGYDEGWTDRGIRSAWFGELNPSHNDEMPAALVEVAFHDTESDCQKLQDPRFRQLAARAFYQAIVRYFAWQDGSEPVFLPEAPAGISLISTGPGFARLTWTPSPTDTLELGGDAATGYRVYASDDGRAFDGGLDVGDTTTYDLIGLPAATTRFYRVTATNAGGESFATPVVAIRQDEFGQKGALIVGAFDRLDRHAQIPEDLAPWDLGTVNHMFLSRMNRFDYVVEHASALAAADMPFDSAWHDAPLTLDLLLDYSLVDWWCGEQSTRLESLAQDELDLLSAYVTQGGRIIVSGSEIGWDLVANGSPQDQAAFGTLFQAHYLGDDAGSYTIALPSGLAISLDDGTHGTYDVDYPDLIGPLGQASAVGTYEGDPARPAGSIYRLANGAGAALLGFPLEAVHPQAARHQLMAQLLAQLSVLPPIPPVIVEPDPVVEAQADIQAPAEIRANADLSVSETPGALEAAEPQRPKQDSGCRANAAPSPWVSLLLLASLLAVLRVTTRV